MKKVGYTDIERGEHGSTEEHLTVTQFKVEREKERLLMQQFVKDGGYDTCPYYDDEYHRGYGPRHHRFRHW